MSVLSEILHRANKSTLMYSDLLVVFEVARVALADADTFDEIAEKMDMSDKEMKRVQEDLIGALEEGGAE